MYREEGESTDNIYVNYVIRGKTGKDSTQVKSSELTGSDSVRIRNYRAAVGCLVLLCVLLLTAVIVLCVTRAQEKQQLISKIENLTNEGDQLILKNTNLTNQRYQLRNELQISDGWTYYQLSFYYVSNVTKNWTESRQDCLKRGADLIIINNSEEQDFVRIMSSAGLYYIGLTDIDVEGTWKWVDGTNTTSSFSFWASGEPSQGREENCAANLAIPPPGWPIGWFDASCDYPYRWICEKRISQLILP